MGDLGHWEMEWWQRLQQYRHIGRHDTLIIGLYSLWEARSENGLASLLYEDSTAARASVMIKNIAANGCSCWKPVIIHTCE